ncbi:helix-turn-helix domain-containing protein [Pseudoalteromonas umbrosa]|uniref:helix-turn-helix domain-containing protein n=1 Tax=Pseudoalteromonas umbrosa TaxID=3048489 RepID=UPI0024C350F1|nr:helix-turn-helix domain-containing protein [Pseudoalteromonas sp. B95]MDK1285950.1 helix-turn-helix domain-containing protein [Pseudoalteromonas sp. B95]
MEPNASEVFEKLKDLYGCSTLKEICETFGKNKAWAGQMIKNNSVPYPQCVQACEDHNVSMDWLLFNKEGQSVDKAELLNLIQEGIFESKELAILEDLTLEQLKATSALVLKQIENIIIVKKGKDKNSKKAV